MPSIERHVTLLRQLSRQVVRAEIRDGDGDLGVEVQGHIDSVGGDAPNMTLSQARADAVKTWRVAHGVAASRLTAKRYGRSQPVADNDSPEGRAKNRRVEFGVNGVPLTVSSG